MKDLLRKIDLLKGYKTKIGILIISIVTIYNIIFNESINAQTVSGLIGQLLDQAEVIVGVIVTVYGLVMKITRMFTENKVNSIFK